MILDNQNNFIWLSALLAKHQSFFNYFSKALTANSIPWALLPKTKDIWCRDYMPVQVDEKSFIQFVYQPDYLQTKRFLPTQSDPNQICDAIGIKPIKSSLVLDGGNVIKGKNWVILTDKIFKENPSRSTKQILKELENLFRVKPIIIPKEPYDWTGHADAVVRFYDETTVLVNDYSKTSPLYRKKLYKALIANGISPIEIPYAPLEKNYTSAHGYYINYLQIQDFILLPVFEIPEDDLVIQQFQELFPKYKVHSILSSSIAKDGGLLNCISWHVLRKISNSTVP